MRKTIVDSKLFQSEMRKSGYTLDTLAVELSLSRTGLFNKIHNKSEFKASEMAVVSSALHLTEDQKHSIFFAQEVECNSTTFADT